MPAKLSFEIRFTRDSIANCTRWFNNLWVLNGISTADFQINVRFFQLIQSYVSLSNRFSLFVCVFVFFFSLFLCVRSRRVFNVNSVSSLDEPFRLLEEMLFIKKKYRGINQLRTALTSFLYIN